MHNVLILNRIYCYLTVLLVFRIEIYQFCLQYFILYHACIYHLLKEKAQNLSVPSGRVKRFRCAFFNFSGGTDQTGGWSYRGLETEIINDTHIRCSASHLTTFVVLVSIIPAVRDPVSVTMSHLFR